MVSLNVKNDFPIFTREFSGHPLIYLDSAATSQKPGIVLDALDNHLRFHNANIHRGLYPLAQEADKAYEDARDKIARFVGAQSQTTIFTKNATEAINLVAYSWGRDNIREDDIILLTKMEHHANLVPWQLLAEEKGALLHYLDFDEQGQISLDELEQELQTEKVKAVAFTHLSNVLGTINPVHKMTKMIRKYGAVSIVDGAQAVPQLPVNIEELDADFYAWTGHKTYGPTGVGVLHGKKSLLNKMRPFISGGDMISSVSLSEVTFNDLPMKFEAGTQPIAEVVGLGEAVTYLDSLDMKTVREHETRLTEYLLESLSGIEGLSFYGPSKAEDRGALLSFSVKGIHPHDIAEIVAREGVAIRAGHHCAQPAMLALGAHATARASLGVYNDKHDVDTLVEALYKAQKLFA